jgi:Zn-dependent protease/CBS domain-containing protein
VLTHELAHSLMAKSRGVPVKNITLFLFGGVSNIQRDPPSPASEFLITIVGPLTSLAIGGILVTLAGVNIGPLDSLGAPNGTIAQLNPFSTLLMWLGSINIVLGLFNLIPGFPLDGGRILRSILWATTDDLHQATRWASWVGQAVAWVFIAVGIAMAFGAYVPIFGSGFINGLWLAFIGWFLNSAAVQSYQRLIIHDVLENVPVQRLMRTNPPVVAPGITISQLVDEHMMKTDDYAFPVLDSSRIIGLITLEDVRKVPRERWDRTVVRDIMTPMDHLLTVSPGDPAADALVKLSERDVRQLPVVDYTGELAGLLRRQDIVRWLQLHSEQRNKA